jgi:hypothetical protein
VNKSGRLKCTKQNSPIPRKNGAAHLSLQASCALAKNQDGCGRSFKLLLLGDVPDVGGVLTIEFGEDRKPHFKVISMEGDQRFDEIGSELKIKQLQHTKSELMEQLTMYYRLVVLGESAEEAAIDNDTEE